MVGGERGELIDAAGAARVGGVLVIGDSLTFHGPVGPELLTHRDLWPSRLARSLDRPVEVVARQGWTARDAWWALTRDPRVYSVLVPGSAAVVLAVGNMDQLPASLPTYLREGMSYLRPGWVRRPARRAYGWAHPRVVRVTRGRMRVLPQRATDAYLTSCVAALRALHPGLVVVGVVPPGWSSRYQGAPDWTHPAAVAAARAWGRREGVPLLDLDAVTAPAVGTDRLNPDGMHWGWDIHAAVADRADIVLRPLLATR